MAKNDSLQKAAGSAVKIELKGNTYTVSPLTLGDLADFEGYLRSRKITDFMAAAKDLPTEERVQVLSNLSSGLIDNDEVLEAFRTMKGQRYLMWKSLSKAHPNLELESMDEIVDVDNIEEATAILMGTGGTDEAPDPTGTSTKVQKKD